MRYILGAYSQLPLGSSENDYEFLLSQQLKPLLTFLYNNHEYRLVLRLGINEFEWLEKKHPEFNMLISDLCRKNQLELLASTYNDSILSLLPGHERSVHIDKTSTFLRKGFGIRPRGLWCYHQVFNPSIIPAIGLCALEYIIISAYNQNNNSTFSNRPFYMDENGKSILIFPSDDKYSKAVFELTKYKESSEKFTSKMQKLAENSSYALNTIMLNLDQLLCCDGSSSVFEALYKTLGPNSILPSEYLDNHEVSKISYMPAAVYGRDFLLGKYNSVNQMIVEDPLLLKIYNLLNILRNSFKDVKKNSNEKKLIEGLLLKANNAAIFVSHKKNHPKVKENITKAINEIESILSEINLLPSETDIDSDKSVEYTTWNKSMVCYLNSKGGSINHLNYKSDFHDYAFFENASVFSDSIREDTSQKTIDLSSRKYEITALDKKIQDFYAKSPTFDLGKQQVNLVKWFKFRQNSINVNILIENNSNLNISNYSYESDLSLNLPSYASFFDSDGKLIEKDEFTADSIVLKSEGSPIHVAVNLSEKCKFLCKNVFSGDFYKMTMIKILKKLNLKAESTEELGITIKFEKK